VAGVKVGVVEHVYAVPDPDAATQFAGTLRLCEVEATNWLLALELNPFADAGMLPPLILPTVVAD
jgi:hypothetical protein